MLYADGCLSFIMRKDLFSERVVNSCGIGDGTVALSTGSRGDPRQPHREQSIVVAAPYRSLGQPSYTKREKQHSQVTEFSSMDEPAPELVPCGICGRRFRKEALERHLPICEKASKKPKKVFDMKAKRRDAIIEDNNVDNAHQVFTKPSTTAKKNPPDRVRRNSFIDPRERPKADKTPPAPKPAPLKRKPANAPRGGPPKPKPEPPKPPTPARRRKAPASNSTRSTTVAGKPGSTPTHKSVSSRSTTPSRATPKQRGTPSPDVNGNTRKISSRTSNQGGIRRAVSSPHIDTNNNKTKKEDPVVKFKDKFPHHVNPHLEALSAAFNKTSSPHVLISIKKPRTVPGVRTGGHSGVEFADPDLLKRPQSSIELDSGWDSKRFTEDYVLQHSPKISGSMTDLRSSNDVCSKCNSPFLVSTAKFCFNCGEKRV